MELEKVITRKVGEAVTRFRMIREGDRVAVGFSGGKDSYTLLAALSALQKRAPIDFSLCAFTIDQGKFLSPIEPFGEWLKERGIDWTVRRDQASVDLIESHPGHGCDMCSRFRRRAVYEMARDLGANVIALGHTADDFCEALLRNAMFTGSLGALPPVTWSRKKEFRLVRPLLYVEETLTTAFAQREEAPVIPCGCNQKTGTVRRSLRDMFAELEVEYPHLKSTMLSAMGNIKPGRMLDLRYLDLDNPEAEEAPSGPFPILEQEVFTES